VTQIFSYDNSSSRLVGRYAFIRFARRINAIGFMETSANAELSEGCLSVLVQAA
jgi:hypothetical protein